jgi:RNA polymerase sigma-70 factor (ECF subfamily)
LELSEHDLLVRALEGNARAFQKLLGPQIPTLRRLAFAFARNWDEADDLAQEAIVKAFRLLPSFEERSRLSTWVYSVARSVCRDWHRNRAVRQRSEDSAAEVWPSAEGLLPDELLVDRELGEELWAAIRVLEPEFRTALVLCDVEGLSYGEIAQIESVPIGTVRSRLHRARTQLRRHLSELHPSLLPRQHAPVRGACSVPPGESA